MTLKINIKVIATAVLCLLAFQIHSAKLSNDSINDQAPLADLSISFSDEQHTSSATDSPGHLLPSMLVLNAATPSSAGVITIQNNSASVTALNIYVSDLTLYSGLSQDASNCALVTPGATCQILVYTTNSALLPSPITITGRNTSSYPMNVAVLPALTFTPSTLPAGPLNTAYSQTITASGGFGPYTYAVTSGTLPVGLSLSSNGVLSGTPTTVNTYNFTITATDTSFNIPGFPATTSINYSLYTGPFLYVSSQANEVVYSCTLSSDGTLNTCTSLSAFTPPLVSPREMNIVTLGGTQYNYVSQQGFSSGLYLCPLSADGSSFASCSQLLTQAFDMANIPGAVNLATVNGTQYAYVPDATNVMYQCALNGNGTFSSCASADSTGPLNQLGTPPFSLAFATTNGTQYAYTGSGNGVVFQCPLIIAANATNGNFLAWACTNTTYSFSSITGQIRAMTFAVVNSVQYAYIGSSNSNQMYACTLNSSGAFTACTQTPSTGTAPGSWAPTSVTIKSINGTQYAYVADSNNHAVWKCNINPSNGTFSSCTAMPVISGWQPFGLAFTA